MRGSFRRDAEIKPDPNSPGSFALVRRRASRMVTRLMIGLSFLAALFDLYLHKPGFAVATLVVFSGFLLVYLFGEAWSWRFSGESVTVSSLELGRFRVREETLRLADIRGVGVSSQGSRTRAWLELQSGAQYALVEGRAADVEKIAGTVERALWLSRMEPEGQTLH